MKDMIKKIMAGEDIESAFRYVLNELYTNGPVSTTVMEILSYLRLYQAEKFQEYEDQILQYMALFYKDVPSTNLKMAVFGMYRKQIKDDYGHYYTPVQASIVNGINENQCFSFSAPTSTGKSYVFTKLIIESSKDVVIVVPSRALINEYYIRINEAIPDKRVNILTFIDCINTAHATRNVFIVTPERCAELFKKKDRFDVEYFLFDEAQLSDDGSKRGLYFDSIVRRSQKAFPNAKYVFAHPFVKNPEAQIKKNRFDEHHSLAQQYVQKSVGQMFICKEGEQFYHFGIEKEVMGNQKVACHFDPIQKAIQSGGSVLIYVAKKSLFNKRIITDFKKYIDLCSEIKDKNALRYIAQLRQYIGGGYSKDSALYSQMLDMMRHGVVIHHGSLPLQARLIIEEFTKAGHCKICFATSTLEQGINMPFDVVYLHRFEASRKLALKNLIGRAGRSSQEKKFDFGYVVIKKDNLSEFRKIIISDEEMKEISALEDSEEHDDDYNEFKEAILNDTFSDEYNLTDKAVEALASQDVANIVKQVLDAMFSGDKLVSLEEINADKQFKLSLYGHFEDLYAFHLKRKLVPGEQAVLNTAIKIMLWRVHCKTFKEICRFRYSYVSKASERRELERKIQNRSDFQSFMAKRSLATLEAAFCPGYNDLPNKNLPLYSMFSENGKPIKAKDVDYDHIVFDTYDYIDKLLGFKLTDIFYAAFQQYYQSTGDARANNLANYIKYGTIEPQKIWMLRYGMTFEDIELLGKYIVQIDEKGITLDDRIKTLSEDQLYPIKRFLP